MNTDGIEEIMERIIMYRPKEKIEEHITKLNESCTAILGNKYAVPYKWTYDDIKNIRKYCYLSQMTGEHVTCQNCFDNIGKMIDDLVVYDDEMIDILQGQNEELNKKNEELNKKIEETK